MSWVRSPPDPPRVNHPSLRSSRLMSGFTPFGMLPLFPKILLEFLGALPSHNLIEINFMLTLLLGPDDFSKKEYVHLLAQKDKADVQVFAGDDNLPDANNLSSQDLFSKPKIFVLKGLIKNFSGSEMVEKFIASKNHIIFQEEKLDKRLNENKQLLANKNIEVKEFSLPHGKELNKWILNRVSSLSGKMTNEAAEALAKTLGRDDAKETRVAGKVIAVEEIYTLWQANSEILKLISFAQDREIGEDDVKLLADENGEVDVFEVTNAIGDSQKQKTLHLLHKFLQNLTGTDEKGAVIKLNALLSEQFRNVALVQNFLANKTSEDKILEATGWKSGRLFVMKKIASKFSPKKILDFLNKLSALDEELKTTQTPPKVLLDLIVAQLF